VHGFFDSRCAIISIAKELCTTNQKKKGLKGMTAE
jgi:hypothetical protein